MFARDVAPKCPSPGGRMEAHQGSLEPSWSDHCHAICDSGVQFEYIQWTVECMIYSSFNDGALIFTLH